MDEYLELNHNLEMSNTKLNKQLELSKNRAVELEAQHFESTSGMPILNPITQGSNAPICICSTSNAKG